MDGIEDKKPTKLSDNDYKLYLELRESLTDIEQDYAKSFDTWVIGIAGGALGLSIAFLKDIVGQRPAKDPGLLVTAWVLLAVCIVLILWSMLSSQRGHEKFREALDAECAKGADQLWDRVRSAQQRRWEPKLVGWLNRVAMIGLLMGLAGLAAFVAFNVLGEPNMAKDQGSRPVQRQVEEKAMKPPVAPVGQDSGPQTSVSPVRVGDKDSFSRKPPVAPVSQDSQGGSGQPKK